MAVKEGRRDPVQRFITSGRSLAIVAAACAALAACGGSGSGGSAASESGGKLQVVLGVPVDQTGGNASGGIEALNSAKLAAQQINSTDSSIHVTLKPIDTQSDAGPGVVAVSHMLQDSGLTGVVGMTYTQTAEGAMPIFQKDGRPTIFIQVTEMKNRAPNVFSMSPPTSPQVTAVVEKQLVPKGIKTAALLWQEQPTLDADVAAAKDAFKAGGISLVDSESTSLTATDFSPQITAILASRPDAIGIMAVGGPTGQIVSQIRSEGYKGLLFGQEGDAVPAFAKAAGEAASGFTYGVWWAAGLGPASSEQYMKLYEKAYPSAGPPAAVGLNAWDAVRIFAQAAKAAGSADPSKIVHELQNGTFHDDMEAKPVTFQSDGFIQRTASVVTVQPSGKIAAAN